MRKTTVSCYVARCVVAIRAFFAISLLLNQARYDIDSLSLSGVCYYFSNFFRPKTRASEAAELSRLNCQLYFDNCPYNMCLFAADRSTWSNNDEKRKNASQLKLVGADLYISSIAIQFGIFFYVGCFYNTVNSSNQQ